MGKKLLPISKVKSVTILFTYSQFYTLYAKLISCHKQYWERNTKPLNSIILFFKSKINLRNYWLWNSYLWVRGSSSLKKNELHIKQGTFFLHHCSDLPLSYCDGSTRSIQDALMPFFPATHQNQLTSPWPACPPPHPTPGRMLPCRGLRQWRT